MRLRMRLRMWLEMVEAEREREGGRSNANVVGKSDKDSKEGTVSCGDIYMHLQ